MTFKKMQFLVDDDQRSAFAVWKLQGWTLQLVAEVQRLTQELEAKKVTVDVAHRFLYDKWCDYCGDFKGHTYVDCFYRKSDEG